MAANEKRTPKDPQGFPLPSSYNAAADRHDVNYGAGNAPRIRIADGDHVTVGSRADEPSSGDLTGSFSEISLWKEALTHLRTLAT